MKTNLTFRPFRLTTVWRNKFLLAALAAALGTSSFPLASSAQTSTSAVPGLISYQGRVTTPAGVLVGIGAPVNRLVIFRIWDHASNSLASNLVYSEQQTATISDGEFSVLIGQGSVVAGTPLGYSETTKGPSASVKLSDAGIFGGATRYLGVTVDDGTATADAEISPRQQIVTSAFAFRAKYAESLGTAGTSTLTALDGGNVGIGFTNPATKLEVNGNVSANGSIAATGAGGFTFRTGDGDGGIFSPADDTVVIKTNSANRVTVTSAGLTLNTGTMYASGYSFTAPGDVDGGIFSAEDGVIAFRTNAAEKMRLDVNGRLGLGNPTPLYTLDIRATDPQIMIAKADATGGAIYFGNVAHGVKRNFNGSAHDVGLFTSGADLYLSANGSTRTTDFALKNNGNVAIGTATVTDKLNVGGNVRVTGVAAPALIIADAANTSRGTLGVATTATQFSLDTAANDTVLRSEAGKLLLQSGTGASALAITSTNLVGIGTAAPGAKLDVGGNTHESIQTILARGADANFRLITQNRSATNVAGSEIFRFGANYGSTTVYTGFAFYRGAGGDDTAMSVMTQGSERVRFTANGRVGMGGQTAPEAPLHVSGSANSTFNRQAYLDADNATAAPFNSSTTQAFSIISDARVRADGFEVNSDLRLKNVVRLSDGREDLGTLLALRITDYTFKDTIEQSAQPQKKVIAQQVEAVFPQAVGRSTNVVPDIFQKAALQDGWVQLATDLKVGERVRLITGEKTAVHTVLAVEATRFRTDLTATTDRVFVYGREVKDFRSVDYDAIAMLNVSATQQLKRDTDAEVTSLRAENATLRAQLAAQDRRLAAIEKVLSAPNTVMARPAAAKSTGTQE